MTVANPNEMVTPTTPAPQPEVLERRITITPAYHLVDNDPAKDRGVGCADLRFALIGPAGAITWTVLSGWMLPETYAWWLQRGLTPRNNAATGGALCDHLPQRTADRQQEAECDLLPGGKCFGDCGYCAGGELFELLVREGSDAVWLRMEQEYRGRCIGGTEADS